MKITLFNCAWTNRGDEAAFRSMVNELTALYPDIQFQLVAHGTRKWAQFPYDEEKVKLIYIGSITRKNFMDIPFLFFSRGRFAVSKNIRALIRIIKESDIVFHNPGGPSMGDLYYSMQLSSYFKFILTRLLGKPYLFYAPSMGPFESKWQNVLRRYIYNGAELITTREALSLEYYKKLGAKKEAIVTADSALQHDFDPAPYEKQFEEYAELKAFSEKYDKVVGVTLATMRWHKIHHTDEIENRIHDAFTEFITYLKQRGYGVVFIPQIFGNGEGNDYPLMQQFKQENCFVCDDEHDCFFQQHLISKLYAVVGLRYHSNIFSAKMETPFVSVTYEQKMNGFVQLAGMDDYLVELTSLSAKQLIEKFEALEKNYDAVKAHLHEIHPTLREKAYQTTLLASKVIDKYRVKSVRDIIENGRCVSCGLCSRICPQQALTLASDKKSGFYRVTLNGNSCVNCGLCRASCPVSRDKTPGADTVGAHRKIVLCHSTDETVRKMATSGGGVNAVIRFLLESGAVDKVVTAAENVDAPFETETVTLDKSNYKTLLDAPRRFASRYVGIPMLSALPDKTESAAIVGVPCQMEALSAYDKENRFFKIAVVCSGATSYNASRALKRHFGKEDWHLYYRGDGWPGYNTLTDGENVIQSPHGKSLFERMYTSQLFRNPACRFCPSHFAESSDITFFDFWNAEERKTESVGNSACIIRTERGEAVYRAMTQSGRLETVRELTETEALESQGVALKYKTKRPYHNAYFALIDFLRKSGLYRCIPVKGYRYLCRLLGKF